MTLEQLQNIFENATDEQLKQINSFYEKDKQEIKTLQDENNSLNTQVLEMKETIQNLESYKNDSEKLSKEFEEYKIKVAEQEEIYKKEKEERRLKEIITDVFSDKKFINDITKQGYAEKLKQAILDDNNKGKSAEELFNAMTDGVENIFVNPQQEKLVIPSVGKTEEKEINTLADALRQKYAN